MKCREYWRRLKRDQAHWTIQARLRRDRHEEDRLIEDVEEWLEEQAD